MSLPSKNFSDFDDVREHYLEELQLKEGFESLEDQNTPLKDTIEVIETENTIIVSSLENESFAQEFWDDDGYNGTFIQFTKDNYEKTKKEFSKSKKLHYLVDRYAHGNVHYSIASTTGYPDQQFDVSHGCGIFVPGETVQQEYKKMKRKDGETEAFMHFIEESNTILDKYSDYCNGEVYQINIVVFNKKGEELFSESYDNLIGYSDTEKYQQSLLKENFYADEIKELTGKLSTESAQFLSVSDLKKENLPFRIDTSNVEAVRYLHVYDHYLVTTQTAEDKNVTYTYVEGDKKPVKAIIEPHAQLTMEQQIDHFFLRNINQILFSNIVNKDAKDEASVKLK